MGYYRNKHFFFASLSTSLLTFLLQWRKFVSLKLFAIYLISSIKFLSDLEPHFVHYGLQFHLRVALQNDLGHPQLNISLIASMLANSEPQLLGNHISKLPSNCSCILPAKHKWFSRMHWLQSESTIYQFYHWRVGGEGGGREVGSTCVWYAYLFWHLYADLY